MFWNRLYLSSVSTPPPSALASRPARRRRGGSVCTYQHTTTSKAYLWEPHEGTHDRQHAAERHHDRRQEVRPVREEGP